MRSMRGTSSLRSTIARAMIPALFSFASAFAARTPAWEPFASTTDGFRALFLTGPEVSRKNVPVGGDIFELRSHASESGVTALYASVCDYGAKGASADPKEMLSSAEKGAVDDMSAQILSEKKIALEANHRVEFEAQSDKLHFTVRMYMAGGRALTDDGCFTPHREACRHGALSRLFPTGR
jgi:hypothetical protein